MATAEPRTTLVTELVPEIYAEVIEPGSQAYQEARALQAQRFARASEPGASNDYLTTVDFAPRHTVPLVIRRRQTTLPEKGARFLRFSRARQAPVHDPVIGTVRLELPGAMITSEVVIFQPGSQATRLLQANAVAEIGGFATGLDLSPSEALDVIDVAVAALVQVAKDRQITCFWIFPRRTLMGLLLAQIPGVLPPYQFTLCRDVSGWNESSPRLEEVRGLRVKGLRALPDEYPIIYECPVDVLASDVVRRYELVTTRHQWPDLGRHLLRAMRVAQQQVNRTIQAAHAELLAQAQATEGIATEASQASASLQFVQVPVASAEPEVDETHGDETTLVVALTAPTGAVAAFAGQEGDQAVATDPGARNTPLPIQHQGFLPFAARPEEKAAYLRALGEQDDVRTYKTLSYQLLDVQPGMQVLDVGCGEGADLPALAELVGPTGHVVGLDRDPDLVRTARQAMVEASRNNVMIWTGNAEATAFPEATFDRVRADRVLQHVDHPDRIVAEMQRMLRHGGIMTLIEPDWRGVVLYPASPAGGDDDTTLSALLGYYQRHLAHALIGRQLRTLLHQPGPDRSNRPNGWSDVRVQTRAFTLTSWLVVDQVLQFSRTARALAMEVPKLARQIDEWLGAVADADRHNQFYATIPLFFAAARKQQPEVM